MASQSGNLFDDNNPFAVCYNLVKTNYFIVFWRLTYVTNLTFVWNKAIFIIIRHKLIYLLFRKLNDATLV